MIHVQEPKIWQNNTTKINEFRQITRLLHLILLAKAAHHQIWHIGETHLSLIIPKRYDKFDTVKILTVSRKQWYKHFENPSKFIFIVHPLFPGKSAYLYYILNLTKSPRQHRRKTLKISILLDPYISLSWKRLSIFQQSFNPVLSWTTPRSSPMRIVFFLIISAISF